jgi:uncharacterized protein
VNAAAAIATYSALGLSIVGLWAGPVVWVPLFLGAIVLGYFGGVLSGLAALWIGLLALACLLYVRAAPASRSSSTRAIAAVGLVGIVALAVLLGAHQLPGFHNPIIARNLVLSPGASPYTQYLNFDKTAAGLVILGICYRRMLRDRRDWLRMLRRAGPIVVVNTVVLVALSLWLGFLRFDPKWTPFFWIWAPVNLFMTCLSEEAFFRGFVQQELRTSLSGHTRGTAVAVGVSAVTFGLAHFAGGWTYVLLAAAAGLGYAIAYQRTGRIEASMTAHFTLNATHFLLFTYPAACNLC